MTKRLTWGRKVLSAMTRTCVGKAVPGSGKTTTLVKRVERLVKTGTDPRSILILMYNKSAQVSFTEKLKTALMSSVIPEIRTFHSLALKIVGYGERQQIIKKKDLITPSDYRYEQLVKSKPTAMALTMRRIILLTPMKLKTSSCLLLAAGWRP